MSDFAKDINVPTNDLIRRQDAIDEIQMLLEQSEDDEHDKTWNNAIRGAVNAVKHHTKSAQPEIIRCKDCKWQQTCGYISTKTISERKNWFCADGEMR